MGLQMPHLERLESRDSNLLAGVLSAALHVGVLFLLMSSGGRYEGVDGGETPTTRLVLLESRVTDHEEGIASPPRELTVPEIELAEPSFAENSELPALLPGEFHPEPDDAIVVPPAEPATATDTIATAISDTPATIIMPEVDESAFGKRLAHLAEEFVKTPRAQAAWEQDGKHYTATLILERAKDGVEFDRVIAEISAEHHGKQLMTRVNLKRLAFSHFTQFIDRWDPMVQLHDDEIVGRLHINSQFNLLYDPRVAPKFLGKVTTAAGSFHAQSIGRRREGDVFRGGIETRAGRIVLPDDVQPFAWEERGSNTRIHELTNDTDIRFFPDGSYTWRDHNTDAAQYRNEPSGQSVYFIGKLGATLYVKGVVSGMVLIYSPRRIVVEGSLTYAHDPRHVHDSRDYLGLVSEKFIEIAPARITGPGNLDIHAAIFAGRRFIVTEIGRGRPATLRIYGSLSAGSMSASEPRYAMKVEYDARFERHRPPSFPSTNRFAAEDWDGRWTEAPEGSASEAF
jgi:hypothetical protein